ncbi:MAG: hypothetical protein L6R39_003789 [Caloplaca ligustica]|nr:MAG: hypothetical protein L6R39_003789 [Caloplaca ligustica]
MSDRAEAIRRLMDLTGGPEEYFANLMDEFDDELDLELYIQRAYNDGKINQDKADIINLALMTGRPIDFCSKFMSQYSDVNAALSAALEYKLIPEEQAASGRLAVVAGVTSIEARKYLVETVPTFSLGQAVQYLKDARRIDEQRSKIALFRLATHLTEADALKYLNNITTQDNITRAIDLAYEDGKLSPPKHVIAHLVHRYGRTESQARVIGGRADVDWNLDKAVVETKVTIVMEQATVDRQDAFKYLNQTKGAIGPALQLVGHAQNKKLVFNGDNGDTRHPPHVTPHTHVIAVLGVADGVKGLASPAEDGWMVSDFYLWKHVLKGMGKTQQWLTCERPADLLARYGKVDKKIKTADSEEQVSWKEGYVHGDPFEERRVVLDDSLLPAVEQELTVTPRGIALRDEFIKRVEDTCRRAESANEPVLVLTFSHGDIMVPELGGLAIGIDPASQNPKDFLNPVMFIDVYMKTPKVHMAIFMSSCHSGHWVVTPRFNVRRPAIMAGARANEETFAVAASSSQRHAGGVYTSAFLAELLKEPPEFPKGSDPVKVRTYEDMSRDVVAEANRLCIPARREKSGTLYGSLPIFTTEGNDDWFYQRSNMQLHPYKLNFNQLRTIPASDPSPYMDKKHDYMPNDPIVKAWDERHPAAADPQFSDRTGGYGTTRRGLKSSTRMLAVRYMSSHPGDDNMAKNIHLHKMVRLFLGGAFDRNYKEIERLRGQLLYRMWMMEKANEYTRGLNLNKLPPIHEWNGAIPDPALAQKFQNENFDVINAAKIFRRPDTAEGEHWGLPYLKPMHYLAHAFAASGYGPEDVERLLQLVEDRNKAATKKTVRTVLGSKRLYGTITELKDLVGRKSPKKRHRGSLSDIHWRPEAGSSGQTQQQWT